MTNTNRFKIKMQLLFILFSNQEIIDFCQCAEITHCLTAKYPIAVSKKSYRGLLRVNQKRNVLEVCVVSTVEFSLVANG